MTFFHLHSHCHLVKGKTHHAIFDIFQERILWLKEEPYKSLIFEIEKGNSLEQFCHTRNLNLSHMYAYLDYLKELDYGRFVDQTQYSEKFRPALLPGQEEKFTLNRPLNRLVMEISSNCSLNCSICRLNKGFSTSLCACGVWPSEKDTSDANDIAENYVNLLIETKKYGIKRAVIQGGDPFLEREILYTIGKKANQNKIPLSIHSPGYSMTEQDLAFMMDNGLELVIPIFGASQATYEAVTKTPDSFRVLTNLLQAFKTSGQGNVTVVVILTQENILEHDKILSLLQGYTIPRIFVEYYYRFDFVDNNNSEINQGFFKLFKSSPEDYLSSAETFFRLAKGHQCWQDQIAVTRGSQVLPCIAARHFKIGNLRSQSLPELLRSRSRLFYRDAGKDSFIPCRDCEYRYGCSSCSLNTEILVGSIQKRSWDCIYDPMAGKWNSPAFK